MATMPNLGQLLFQQTTSAPWAPKPQPSLVQKLNSPTVGVKSTAPATLSANTTRTTTTNSAPRTSSSSSSQSAPEVSAPDTSGITNQINENYQNALNLINQRAAALPGYQAQDTGYVTDQYGNMVKSLQQGQQSAQEKLGLAGQAVQANKATSIADLGSNLRQMMNATQMQLGALGAGDSSASQVMAPYAFSKIAAKEGAGIQRQANQQLADIESKKVDLQSTYNTQLAGIEQWKGDQLNQLTQYYRGLQSQIEDAKMNASAERGQQLQQLEVGLFNTATQKAQQIETEARNYQASLSQWATQRIAELNNARMAMTQNANFDPQQMTFNELGGMNMGSQGGDALQTYISRKAKDLYGTTGF